MEYSIERAVASDIPSIVAIHQDCAVELAGIAAEGYGDAMREEQPESELAAMFRACLDNGDGLLLVARSGKSVCAFLCAAIEEHGDDLLSSPYLTIEFVETEAGSRGHGIAEALIRTAELFARERGIRHVDLLVWETNAAARRLYERLGYGTLERRMVRRIEG